MKKSQGGFETLWLSYLSGDKEEAPGAAEKASQETWAITRHQPRHGPGGDAERSVLAGGRVSSAAAQPGRFEWERLLPAGGVPRECGSPRPVARRPRPSTLLPLPLRSAKLSQGCTTRFWETRSEQQLLLFS